MRGNLALRGKAVDINSRIKFFLAQLCGYVQASHLPGTSSMAQVFYTKVRMPNVSYPPNHL